ncbi:S-adenosyl-L-methionine-dependent methyltransferase [Pavlovales sp. CCMP2436]|nr:S-adenosyl-L-methionine-dependent methyltransferase [Pavlovales sp. CCMP2436]
MPPPPVAAATTFAFTRGPAAAGKQLAPAEPLPSPAPTAAGRRDSIGLLRLDVPAAAIRLASASARGVLPVARRLGDLRDFGKPPAVAAALDRSAVYEHLYAKGGYHQSLGVTHALPIINERISRWVETKTRPTKRILDVGCSHGMGVQTLWNLGFRASGTDLATTAVDMATKARVPPGRNCDGDKCFKQGSAAQLPWADGAFDALMSTDVLEHVPKGLLEQTVREFTRVTREKLFLIIATALEWDLIVSGPTGSSSKIGFTQKLGGPAKLATLHETVEGPEWWIDLFQSASGGAWSCRFVKETNFVGRWKRGVAREAPKKFDYGALKPYVLDSHGQPMKACWLECTRRHA